MISKLSLSIALIGFIGVGGLLMTNHPGMAIKVTNYLFFLVLFIVLYEMAKK